MAKSRKKKSGSSGSKVADYRHPDAKRTNIPPAKLAGEGKIPKMPKAKYYYSPHLSPELRFDSTGKADRIQAMVAESMRRALRPEEARIVAEAIQHHQPWLEWAAKREQQENAYFEVDPVALHIHERVSAQAIVRAAMRTDVQRDLFADPQQPYSEAVQFYRHSIDWSNRLILGDSLQVMSSLSRREGLTGKIQMVFMDPPYGITFGSNFQSELSNRDVKDKDSDLTREPEMVRAYRDTWNLGLHSYLRYLSDRLHVARDLLHPEGSIFVQIGDENLHTVRALLDEVFGSSNFVSIIAFQRGVAGLGGMLSNVNDWILWYARNKALAKYRPLFVPRSDRTIASAYNYYEVANGVTRRLTRGEINGEVDLPEGKRFKTSAIVARDASATSSFLYEFAGQEYKLPPNTHWKTSRKGLDRLALADRLLGLGKTLTYKMYTDDFPLVPLSNIWQDVFESTFAVERYYVVQTPLQVVERCVLMCTDPGDLVLDPTCGSGTLAVAAEQRGRRWITVDTSRVAISLARQRLLTARYELYRTKDGGSSPKAGFANDFVAHVTLKSIVGNSHLDHILDTHELRLNELLTKCNAALALVSEELRAKLQIKLRDHVRTLGKAKVGERENRLWQLPREKFEHATVPFDTDPEWPKQLQVAVLSYRQGWREKMSEVNGCIVTNAEQEELVDSPEIVKGVVRVTGPFTVEGVKPQELSLEDEGLVEGNGANGYEALGGIEIQSLNAYLTQLLNHLRTDGLTFINNKHQKFATLEPLFETSTASVIHAEGSWDGKGSGEPNVAVSFGPQYGPVSVTQVEDAIRASRRYDELVIAGFSFDAESSAVIQEAAHPKLRIHQAYIRPDINPGMEGLLKDTAKSQLFTVFGQPEVNVGKNKEGEWVCTLEGVDIYDPVANTIKSTGADKVAAWFLDGDYDGRCFCITQAFFPDQDAWEKIARALGADADIDAFEAFKGTKSLPFPTGKHNRIAVKVIDPRGNEVMAIRKLKD